MALIECKECGKRISDTSDVCIHCGAPTAVSVEDGAKESPIITDDVDENIGNAEIFTDDADAKAPMEIFQNLNAKKQAELEREFWKADKRAKAYRAKGGVAFVMFLTSVPLVFLALFSALFSEYGKLTGSNMIVNVKNREIYQLLYFEGVPVIFLIFSVLFFWCIVCWVRYTQNNKKRILYKKRFQKWLEIEKNIEYIPQFQEEYDRKKWNAVDLNQKL